MSKYIIKENNEIVLETNDYILGYSNFIEKIKKIIRGNFGFFGDVGLPYGLEAYLCVDEEICNNEKLTKKADDILNLFKQIQTSGCPSVNKKNLRNIYFSDGEWNFEFKSENGLVNIVSYDDVHYLNTNIFNNLKYTNQLYFRFCLERVISPLNEISKLGEEAKYEITINKID